MPAETRRNRRDEGRTLREALRAAVRRSRLGSAQVEQRLGLREGSLDAVFTGKAELQVAHLFAILRAIEAEPRSFFLEVSRVEERRAQNVA